MMPPPRSSLAAVVAFSLLVAGCDQPASSPTQPSELDAALTESPKRAVYPSERLFTRLAEEVEGFGGYYLEPDGSLVAYLTDPSRAEELVSRLTSAGDAEMDVVQGRHIVIRHALYNFLQLQRWRDQLSGPVLSAPGTVLLHVDEARNRVTIGIADEHFRQDFVRIISELRIPTEAVGIEVTGPIRTDHHTLADSVRPVRGGLRQRRVNSDLSLGAGCTIGFIAKWNGLETWVTNSHCTEVERAVVSGSQYFQNEPGTGTYIGKEIHDPPGFSCHFATDCRYSDAALLELDSAADHTFGMVARTAGPIGVGWGNPGSIDVNHDRPNLRIVGSGKMAVVGAKIDKIGHKTGWTTGTVQRTCVHYPTSGGRYLLCQHSADYWRQGGDSGSPVFERTDDTDEIILSGIHWGVDIGASEAIFSPMSGMQEDLGSLSVTVPAKLKVAISGPDQVEEHQYCEWSAQTSGGTVPYQYQWYREGHFVGGGSYYQTSDTGDSDFLLELFVTDSLSQAASAWLQVTVSGSTGVIECEF